MLKTTYDALRKAAFCLLGGKCKNCGSRKKLQLHHKYYARNSIRATQKENGWQTIKRTREAIAHPKRFRLLCLSCHNIEGKTGTHYSQKKDRR